MSFMQEKPASLLTVSSTKTVKGENRGYLTGILYLHPYKSHGFNICPNAESAGCHEPCLNTAGRGQFNSVQTARLRKTKLFHDERDWFMTQLFRDIEALERKAHREGLIPVVRLNGTSDLDWESIRHKGFSAMEQFSRIQFYDYTKTSRIPSNRNYHLTFSYSSAPKAQLSLKRAVRRGMNIAVVFRGQFPDTFLDREVVDGEKDDLRFLDPAGVVVGLTAKGLGRKTNSPLIIDTQPQLIAVG